LPHVKTRDTGVRVKRFSFFFLVSSSISGCFFLDDLRSGPSHLVNPCPTPCFIECWFPLVQAQSVLFSCQEYSVEGKWTFDSQCEGGTPFSPCRFCPGQVTAGFREIDRFFHPCPTLFLPNDRVPVFAPFLLRRRFFCRPPVPLNIHPTPCRGCHVRHLPPSRCFVQVSCFFFSRCLGAWLRCFPWVRVPRSSKRFSF